MQSFTWQDKFIGGKKKIKPISPKIDYFILLKVGHIQYEKNPSKIFGTTQSSWHVPSKLSTNTRENQHWRFLGTDRSHQRIHAFGYSTDQIPVISVSSRNIYGEIAPILGTTHGTASKACSSVEKGERWRECCQVQSARGRRAWREPMPSIEHTHQVCL